jgi:hypothetical protein
MKLQDIFNNWYFRTNLYEMSNFRSNTTGLSNGTELFVRAEPVTLPHVKYRIKISHVQRGSAVFAIWGDDAIQVAGNWKVSGDDLNRIKTLVALNKSHLIKHIDGTEDSADLAISLMNTKQQVLNS